MTVEELKSENEVLRKAWENWKRIAESEHETVKTLTTWLEKLLAVETLTEDSKKDCRTIVAQIKKGTERFPKS